MLPVILVYALATCTLASAAPGGILAGRASTAAAPSQLRGVVENSGVCETTSGVYTASGYGDISDGSIWFWFFEARNNPETAPLTIWLEGEGGTSSMVGLLTESGPCRLSDDGKTVSLNPYSFNEVSNMLYIDQPFGVGFSYGSGNITTTQTAAEYIWEFLQAFFADTRFTKYQSNNLGLWSKHYGGNIVSTFATYSLEQNDAIDNGTVSGLKINVTNVGMGGPYMDPLSQLPWYLDYSIDNQYAQLVSAQTVLAQTRLWFATDNSGIEKMVSDCYNGGSTLVCWNAVLAAQQNYIAPLSGNYSQFHVNSNATDTSTQAYLSDASLRAKIGATSNYTENNIFVAYDFDTSGAWIRNTRPLLEGLINKGILVGMWAGDADFIGNNLMTEALASDLATVATENFYFTPFSTYRVNGEAVGQFKQLPPLTYVDFQGAGHNIGQFSSGTLGQGQAALQFFSQIIQGQTITSS